jgi:DNA-binding MarR family transcriptional regulator
MASPLLSQDEKRAFQLFLAAYSAVTRKVGKDLAQHTELTLEQYDVLLTLEYEEGHRLRLSDLAEKVLLSRSGLTRMIDRLEAKGWVKREECEDDRRGSYAVLTPKGHQARLDSWPVLELSMKRHYRDRLEGEEDVAALARVARRLAFGSESSGFPWDE